METSMNNNTLPTNVDDITKESASNLLPQNTTTDTSLNISTDTIDVEMSDPTKATTMNSNNSPPIKSAVVIGGGSSSNNNNDVPAPNSTTPIPNHNSNDDDIDPDIDVAAEQIVNAFTEHLNTRSQTFPAMVEAITDPDTDNDLPGSGGLEDDEEDKLGIMSTSLAAGGFEELIVGLDNSYNPNYHPSTNNNNNNNNNSTNSLTVSERSSSGGANRNMNHPATTMNDSYIVEDVVEESETLEEEEVSASDYDEEEVVEEEVTEIEEDDDNDNDNNNNNNNKNNNSEQLMNDVDIHEMMEESGVLMAEQQNQSSAAAAAASAANDIREISRDEALHGIQQLSQPSRSTLASSTEPSVATISSLDSTMEALAAATTPTTPRSLGDSDSLAISTSTRQTMPGASSSNNNATTDLHQQQSLYGDVLLGDMSEMTMGSRSDAYFDSQHQPSTIPSTTHHNGNLLSRQSGNDDDDDDDDDDDEVNTFAAASFKYGTPSASVNNSGFVSPASSTKRSVNSSSSNKINKKKKDEEDDNPMASAASLTAAVAAAAVAAAAVSNNHHQQNATTAAASNANRSAASSSMGSSSNDTIPTDYYNPPKKSMITPVPPALQRPVQESMSVPSPSNNENEIPVPPALSGAPYSDMSTRNDIESGMKKSGTNKRLSNSRQNEPEMAKPLSSNQKEDHEKGNRKEKYDEANRNKDTTNAGPDNHENNEISEGMNLSIYAVLLLCLGVVFMVVMLSVFLTRKDKDGDREIPTNPPVPTVAPILPPTNAPQFAGSEPPTVLGAWTQSIPPVFGVNGSSFGTAIVMDDNMMWSVGAPNLINEDSDSNTGGVFTSRMVDDNWVLIPSLYGENSGDMYGTAIDMSLSHMIVGAPMSLIPNTTTSAGAAYYYSLDTSNLTWSDPFIFRSADDLVSANGEFGAAVALGFDNGTDLPRVVIGAPRHNLDTVTYENGRVYTYQSTAYSWESMETNPIIGKNSLDLFGFSVDMSLDGARFIVGAPGQNVSAGYFQIYEWDGTQWILDYEEDGNPGEAFGSYVTIISRGIFAVGGPGYDNGSGRVVVYQRSSSTGRESSSYTILGEPIVGAPGDRLGSDGSISGGKYGDSEEIILIVATSTGTIQTYSLDEYAGKWKPHVEPLATGHNGMVYVEYSSSAGLLTGYPANDEVSFYFTETVNITAIAPTASPTTTVPVVSPTAGGEVVATESPTMVTNSTTTEAPTSLNSTDSNTTIIEPPPSQGTWVLVAESFTPQPADGSGYGPSSVSSLTSTSLIIGAPTTLGNGAVFVYSKDATTGAWTTEAAQQLFGIDAGVQFGASVDLSNDSNLLAVGAPRTLGTGTITEFGAAYCYELVNGQYQSLGGVILGDSDIYSASEMFGSSVAATSTSSVRRIAVGAPFNNLENVLLRGRVYVYEYDGSLWNRISSLLGQSANSTFGTSIDMSDDGSIIMIGAPGTSYVELYVYDGTQYTLDYQIMSTVQTTTGFGTIVRIVTDYLFAVSDPNYNNNQGRVVVYTKDDVTGEYAQVGSDIVGVSGSSDQFGIMMTGIVDATTSIPAIIIGSSNGSVMRYDYNESSGPAWVEHPTASFTSTFGAETSSIGSSSASSNEMVITSQQNAEIYQWS